MFPLLKVPAVAVAVAVVVAVVPVVGVLAVVQVDKALNRVNQRIKGKAIPTM